MKRTSALSLLGILVFVSPFVGLPYGYLMALLPLLGLGIVLVAHLRPSSPSVPVHDAQQGA